MASKKKTKLIVSYEPITPTVDINHGGYGVMRDGVMTGPFFNYGNAVRTAARLSGSVVVRWLEFTGTKVELKELTGPLTVTAERRVYVPNVTPEAQPRYKRKTPTLIAA